MIIKTIITALLLSIIYNINIFASDLAKVDLRVEGINSTIMEGKVEADTFINAVQKLGNELNIEVIIKTGEAGEELYSISGIKNGLYNQNDAWKAYIIRKNSIIDVDNILNTSVLNDDKLVLYYGNSEITKKVTNIKETYDSDNQKLSLTFLSATTIWLEENGDWIPKDESHKLKGIRVHFSIGDSKPITKITDDEGKVEFDLKSPNMYTYYAEGYQDNNIPTIVKVPLTTNIIGLNTENSDLNLTRAEITSFLVNYFNIPLNNEVEPLNFKDVLDSSPYYNEIKIASSQKFINGDDELNFHPDNSMTLQEFIVVVTNINKTKPKHDIEISYSDENNSSDWAKPYINRAVQMEIIEAKVYDFQKLVNIDDIIDILQNYSIGSLSL